MVKLQSSKPKLIWVRQNRINASFLKRYFIFTLDFIFLMFSHRLSMPVLSHSYIMSKNLAFPERIYICLVDLRGNKSETCHTNETRMRHFLVPNGNDHARRAIESILNKVSFFLLATYLEGTLVAKPQNQGKCLNSTQLWMVQLSWFCFRSSI